MRDLLPKTAPPSTDKRWRIVDTAMRRNGYAPDGLIETLHAIQETFGYLDEPSMRYVASSLRVPLSKVYGVATFYHLFLLKPQGEHSCVVCLGTACYIKGSSNLLEAVRKRFGIRSGETTPNNKLSLLTARCVGSCSLAPVSLLDGETLPHLTPEQLIDAICALDEAEEAVK